MLAGVGYIVITIAAGVLLSMGLTQDNATLYIYFNMVTGTIFGIFMAVIAFTTNGCIGPLMSAKASGESIISVGTVSGKWRWRSGREQNGIVPTKDGSFMVTPGSMLSLPNGVKMGMAHYKEGIVIPPQFAVACTKMAEKGILDVRQMDKAEEDARAEKKEFTINLE